VLTVLTIFFRKEDKRYEIKLWDVVDVQREEAAAQQAAVYPEAAEITAPAGPEDVIS
jgi:hypothetical protein